VGLDCIEFDDRVTAHDPTRNCSPIGRTVSDRSSTRWTRISGVRR
jgi:hypothetical protein